MASSSALLAGPDADLKEHLRRRWGGIWSTRRRCSDGPLHASTCATPSRVSSHVDTSDAARVANPAASSIGNHPVPKPDDARLRTNADIQLVQRFVGDHIGNHLGHALASCESSH